MEIKNFAIIEGTRAQIKDGKITYKPISKRSRKSTELSSVDKTGIENSVIRSDVTFGNGILEFNVKFKSHNTGIIIRLTSFDNKLVRCGYSRLNSKFVIANNLIPIGIH